jgi:hypothetical protein
MAMDIGWFQHIKQIIEQDRFRWSINRLSMSSIEGML